jgi:hypothetical protein
MKKTFFLFSIFYLLSIVSFAQTDIKDEWIEQDNQMIEELMPFLKEQFNEIVTTSQIKVYERLNITKELGLG